jgi:hypothetical protein
VDDQAHDLEMAPIQPTLDRRGELGDEPGLHALIVGVSDCRYLPMAGAPPDEIKHKFGMTRLTSPALSAVRVWRWLVNRKDKLAAKLATCRLLLRPSPAEIAASEELKKFPPGASFNEFAAATAEWRASARQRTNDITFLYFAGHGVQEANTEDHVVLLEDFAAPGAALRNGVRVSEILAGMAPRDDQPAIARTQLYFFDTCRNTPEQFEQLAMAQVGSIWDMPRTQMVDDRACPWFCAAEPRGTAYAGKDHQTLFSQALLACLEGGAGTPLDEWDLDRGWAVSVASLAGGLSTHLDLLNAEAGANQAPSINRYNGRPVIHFLDAPPPVDVTLTVTPDGAIPVTRVAVFDEADAVLRDLGPPADHPYRDTLKAGDYRVVARIDPGAAVYATKRTTLKARPPLSPIQLRVGP